MAASLFSMSASSFCSERKFWFALRSGYASTDTLSPASALLRRLFASILSLIVVAAIAAVRASVTFCSTSFSWAAYPLTVLTSCGTRS